MLTIHCAIGCPECRRLAERLGERSLAYRMDEFEPLAEGAHTLVDDHEIVHGHAAMAERVDLRTRLRERMQHYQTDACLAYGDEDDEELCR